MDMQNINTELLRKHGFIVTEPIGYGMMGQVFKGICSERANRLVETKRFLGDTDWENIVIIDYKMYTTESISGKWFAVKTFSHLTGFRVQYTSPSTSESTTSGFPELPQNISPTHSGSTVSLSGFPEWAQNISPTHSGSTVSLSGFPDWAQNISPTHSGSPHLSQASVHSELNPYVGESGQSGSQISRSESESRFPDWLRNISRSHSFSGHSSEDNDLSQSIPYYATQQDRGQLNLPNEASIHLGLNHRNIVQIYDVVNDPQNCRFYIIMELMDMSLKDYVKTVYLELGEFYNLAAQLLTGLDYLHKRNIYHNDIHEENIMVKKTDEGVVLKYVDFGFSTHQPIKSAELKDYTFKDIYGLGVVFVILLHNTFVDYRDYDYEKDIKDTFVDIFDGMKSGIYATVGEIRDALQDLMIEVLVI